MSEADAARTKVYIVPGLVRGLRLLELFGPDSTELSLSECARKLGISRSSAFRLAFTLESLGFLRKNMHKRFELGPRVLSLGFGFLSGLDIVDLARTPLAELRDATEASSHMAIRDGTEIVYLVRCAARQHLTTNIGVGTRLPVHATALGRVLLFDTSDSEVRQLYAESRLPSFSDQTANSVNKLCALLAEDRERGYVVSEGYFDSAISTVAAPVRNRDGVVVAAISVSAPRGSVNKAQLAGPIKSAVCDTARQVAGLLGYQSPEDDELSRSA